MIPNLFFLLQLLVLFHNFATKFGITNFSYQCWFCTWLVIRLSSSFHTVKTIQTPSSNNIFCACFHDMFRLLSIQFTITASSMSAEVCIYHNNWRDMFSCWHILIRQFPKCNMVHKKCPLEDDIIVSCTLCHKHAALTKTIALPSPHLTSNRASLSGVPFMVLLV